jgi:type I restriction enzyme S subunit
MKPYNKYKPSGIEWLGEIPDHWEVKRVKDLTSKIGSGVTPSGGAEVYSDSGIPFFRSQNVHNNRLSIDDIVYISEEIDNSMSNSRIRPNDILLNITGASIGRCYYTPGSFKKGNVNQHVCIIRPIQKKIKTNFLHFEIISQYGQILIEISQNGANREGLNFQQIKNFVFAIPAVSEQSTIASYLDTKTATIDRKIELLTSKADKYKALRRSLINETVCRGLNPDVTMKDSGIEWIGKIPEHWCEYRMKDLGFLYSGLSGKAGEDFNQEENYNNCDFIPFTNIFNNDTINPDIMGKVVVSENEKQNKVKKNDLFFLMSSEDYDGLGKSSLLTVDLKNTYLNSFCKGFRITKKYVLPAFLNYQLQSESFRKIMQIEGKGFTRMNLKMEKVNDFSIYIPDTIEEQTAIVKYLNVKNTQIDTIITNIGEQINKLTQLRKTLINDVVTGKIKVTD